MSFVVQCYCGATMEMEKGATYPSSGPNQGKLRYFKCSAPKCQGAFFVDVSIIQRVEQETASFREDDFGKWCREE